MSCDNHKKDLYGETDMRVVAEAIGDLHYETLGELFSELCFKLSADGMIDLEGKRKTLAKFRFAASNNMMAAAEQMKGAWQISKKFM